MCLHLCFKKIIPYPCQRQNFRGAGKIEREIKIQRGDGILNTTAANAMPTANNNLIVITVHPYTKEIHGRGFSKVLMFF